MRRPGGHSTQKIIHGANLPLPTDAEVGQLAAQIKKVIGNPTVPGRKSIFRGILGEGVEESRALVEATAQRNKRTKREKYAAQKAAPIKLQPFDYKVLEWAKTKAGAYPNWDFFRRECETHFKLRPTSNALSQSMARLKKLGLLTNTLLAPKKKGEPRIRKKPVLQIDFMMRRRVRASGLLGIANASLVGEYLKAMRAGASERIEAVKEAFLVNNNGLKTLDDLERLVAHAQGK